MIKYIKGDIFNSECAVLVNPVNCVGVMRKGLALEFKNRYPVMFQTYKKVCHTKQLCPERPMFVYGPDKSVILFPTKYVITFFLKESIASLYHFSPLYKVFSSVISYITITPSACL